MADPAGTQTSLTTFALDFAKGATKGKLPSFGSLTRALGGAVFDEVVFDSQFSPELSMQPWAPGDGQPSTPSEPLASILGNYTRPRARLRKGGETIATFAPYGEPNGVWLPNAVGGVAAIAGATAFLLGHRKSALTLGLVAAAGFGIGYLARPTT